MPSLLNGLAGLGSGLNTLAGNALTDEADKAIRAASRSSLLNDQPIPPPSQPAAPAPTLTGQEKPGPRMPAGTNPYAGNPHAAALWLAERAILGPESGGKANAQNTVTSAGGLFQITDATWDAAAKKLGLPLAGSDAERNAQKYQPYLNTRVMRLINTEAASALDAQGLPVTPQTLQAAHRLGPAGAAQAIKAALVNPDAPLVGNGLSPSAVKGNGDVANMTVGEFLMRPFGARTAGDAG